MTADKTKSFILAQSVILALAIGTGPQSFSQQTNLPHKIGGASSTSSTPLKQTVNEQHPPMRNYGICNTAEAIKPPVPLLAVNAEYTERAKRAHWNGVCVVSAVVDVEGLPRDVYIKKPLGLGLDENAIAAVKQYRFKPGTLNGKPVPVCVDIIVSFHNH